MALVDELAITRRIDATFRPVRTDDLQAGLVGVGYRAIWSHPFRIEGGEYDGQVGWTLADRDLAVRLNLGWAPECDLKIHGEVPRTGVET